jgi:hypothetical protein
VKIAIAEEEIRKTKKKQEEPRKSEGSGFAENTQAHTAAAVASIRLNILSLHSPSKHRKSKDISS